MVPDHLPRYSGILGSGFGWAVGRDLSNFSNTLEVWVASSLVAMACSCSGGQALEEPGTLAGLLERLLAAPLGKQAGEEDHGLSVACSTSGSGGGLVVGLWRVTCELPPLRVRGGEQAALLVGLSSCPADLVEGAQTCSRPLDIGVLFLGSCCLVDDVGTGSTV